MHNNKSIALILLSGSFIFSLLSIILLIIKSTPADVVTEIKLQNTPSISYTPSLPTIDMIFADEHTWVATLPAQSLRTIIVIGDVIPTRSVNFKAITYKDFTWPYKKTADTIKNADITFINLEKPLLANCQTTVEV